MEVLEVSGCIVAIDDMGYQKEIARKIVKKGADYALALKKNRGRLYGEALDTFESAQGSSFTVLERDFQETVGKGRGSIETRRCWVIWEPEVIEYLNEKAAWPNPNSLKVLSQ